MMGIHFLWFSKQSIFMAFDFQFLDSHQDDAGNADQ